MFGPILMIPRYKCFLKFVFINRDTCLNQAFLFWFLIDVSSYLLTDDLSANKVAQQYKTSIGCQTCVDSCW